MKNMTQEMREQIGRERQAGFAAIERLNVVVGDLTCLVRRLAHSLRQAAPDNDLPEKALDYLSRKGLQDAVLRQKCIGCDDDSLDSLCDVCRTNLQAVFSVVGSAEQSNG